MVFSKKWFIRQLSEIKTYTKEKQKYKYIKITNEMNANITLLISKEIIREVILYTNTCTTMMVCL